MENRFNLFSEIKEKNNYTSDDLPNFNEIEIKDLIINDINLDNLISVKSKYINIEFNTLSLYSSYFVQTLFEECIFQNVDFTKSNLNNTSLKSCSFISCSLQVLK
ncbi:pentapeptide repeat-containing protein [Chryseobacterium arachidis]|uniref:pentapeptide repeat-containing protein n=1 Tax=Chryseobacterium arachidis TaxID=1416778 RepID=UPI00361E8C53